MRALGFEPRKEEIKKMVSEVSDNALEIQMPLPKSLHKLNLKPIAVSCTGGQGQLWQAELGCFHAADGQQDGREGHQGGDNEGLSNTTSSSQIYDDKESCGVMENFGVI